MCGIVGYTGTGKAKGKGANPSLVIFDGLKRLEYRGYDSAGIAFATINGIEVIKATGSVSRLEEKFNSRAKLPRENAAIGHTRWATHGKVSHDNAHPHASDNVAIVHNGIIDNANELREWLEKLGYEFLSETDSEVIAHLIDSYIVTNSLYPLTCVETALKELHGTYGLAVIFKHHPDTIIVAKNGSPLSIGIGKDEHFVASDTSALAQWTNRFIHMEDGDIAVLNPSSMSINNNRAIETIDIVDGYAEKGDFEHYMLKEIFEQPDSIRRCFGGRIRDDYCVLGGFNLHPHSIANITSVTIIGCGTSYHAALIAKNIIERTSNIKCSVELASEFAYGKIIPDKRGIYLAVSQSGETYDTIQCIKELQRKGCIVYGVVNVVGSSIARLCGNGMYVHAGPEIAVASTKAFTSQLAALMMFASMLGRTKYMTQADGENFCFDLSMIPSQLMVCLDGLNQAAKDVAKAIKDAPYVLFLGRGISYPVAMEGALKLKEIAYIPCEAYAGGEMKHGPIAMIDEGTPVICINPVDSHHGRMLSNMEEVKARGAQIISLTSVNDKISQALSDVCILMPHGFDSNAFSPFFSILPLQLIAYHVAKLKGCDIDKPRNLAKAVTVG